VQDAQRYFDAAIQVAPQLSTLYLQLHQLLVEKGEFDQAFTIYQRLVVNQPGAIFLPARYQIAAIIGKNTLGVIYRAWDTEQNAWVEVTLADHPSAVTGERVSHLRTTLLRLQSAYISRIFDVAHYQGRYFYVSESVQAETLRAYLDRVGVLSEEKKFAILEQIAAALAEGHKHDLPYLNLNPTNVLVTEQGIKLTRYGEAHLLAYLWPFDNGLFAGPPSTYHAPEQLAGALGNQASDIYALGVLTHELFTGHLPLQHSPTASSAQTVDEAIALLVEHACRTAPGQRFATIAFMRHELARITTSNTPPGLWQTPRWLLHGLTKAVLYLEKPALRAPLLIGLLTVGVLSTLPTLPLSIVILSRFLLLVALALLPVNLLFRRQVREIANDTGHVSLVQSSRGMALLLALMRLR
jgi:serine/threonine protein kinase